MSLLSLELSCKSHLIWSASCPVSTQKCPRTCWCPHIMFLFPDLQPHRQVFFILFPHDHTDPKFHMPESRKQVINQTPPPPKGKKKNLRIQKLPNHRNQKKTHIFATFHIASPPVPFPRSPSHLVKFGLEVAPKALFGNSWSEIPKPRSPKIFRG